MPSFRRTFHHTCQECDPPDGHEATLKFDKSSDGGSIVLNGTLTKDKAGFEFAGDDVASKLFAQFGTKFGPEETNPPCPLVVRSAELKFTGGALPALDKNAVNALTIKWIKCP